MQYRHTDSKLYIQNQVEATRKYVVPYISRRMPMQSKVSVLEVGCGKGGNLLPFLEKDCQVTGVDISSSKIKKAHEFYQDHPKAKNLTLVDADIYTLTTDELGTFDVIFMKDVIEHIPNQEKFMAYLKSFLSPGGVVFFAFPPWQMPFGGHQQMCTSKIASHLPYYHLLSKSVYRSLLRIMGESPKKIENLLEIKDTGISLDRFERILKTENYKILERDIYFINPNYEVKFGLKPRKQLPILADIPYLRNFISTCGYYLVGL